jgi:hypothetical protein
MCYNITTLALGCIKKNILARHDIYMKKSNKITFNENLESKL